MELSSSASWREWYLSVFPPLGVSVHQTNEPDEMIPRKRCIYLQCGWFIGPISVVTGSTMLLMKVILPITTCGIRSTPLFLITHSSISLACRVFSLSSLLNAVILLNMAVLSSYIIAIAYLRRHFIMIKAFCCLLYLVPLTLFQYTLIVRIIHVLDIEVVDWLTFAFFLWSWPVTIVCIVFIIEPKSMMMKCDVQGWRNKAVIFVAISAVFSFLMLSEGVLLCFFVLVTAWDLLAVNWSWGPIRLMLDHQNEHKAVILQEQPQGLREIEIVLELATRRQRALLLGGTAEDVDHALDRVAGVSSEAESAVLPLPQGLSYQAEAVDDTSCEMGLLDIVVLGIVVGLAAKRPGISPMIACHVAALVGAMAATLHSIIATRTVPALPAALGTCLVIYGLCWLTSLQFFIDKALDSMVYF